MVERKKEEGKLSQHRWQRRRKTGKMITLLKSKSKVTDATTKKISKEIEEGARKQRKRRQKVTFVILAVETLTLAGEGGLPGRLYRR